jgi:hypothetical protein
MCKCVQISQVYCRGYNLVLHVDSRWDLLGYYLKMHYIYIYIYIYI